MDDETLIEQYYGCSGEALEALYTQWGLSGKLHARLCDLTDKDTVVQVESETWRAVMGSKVKRLAGGPGAKGTFASGKFASWIHTIAINKLKDHFRRARRLRPCAPDNPVFARAGERSSVEDEVSLEDSLRYCLSLLSAEQRAAFVLCVLEQRTLEDAARILGASRATVGRRRVEADSIVRKYLRREGWGA